MSMQDSNRSSIPSFFQYCLDRGLIRPEQILSTADGFYMLSTSLASILSRRDIHTFPDKDGNILACDNFFDDWFLFAVGGKEPVYGLVKMREQESDRKQGLQADGDTPGVTVSFIDFPVRLLADCLDDPSPENRRNLGIGINRVVAYRNQKHHPALKAYFVRPQAEAPYLLAETYVHHMAAFSREGILPVPEAYREIYRKRTLSPRYARIPDFLERNNRDAGTTVCDHETIRIRDPKQLSAQEKLAILATHTGNVSVHSFAAEIRYHALFLIPPAKIRLPLLGSPYASAVRADMSIGDKEFQGPVPYYNLSGRMVRKQKQHHPNFP